MDDPTQPPSAEHTDSESFLAGEATDDMVEDNKKTGKKLVMFICVMFGFAAASIPLYRLVCRSIDPGGSSAQNGQAASYEGVEVDKSRTIDVRLAAEVNRGLPWTFKPKVPTVSVHPGEKKLTKFVSKNLDTSRSITGKAVYDINPPAAGQYFKKIQCFCFTQQTLDPGEKADMPLYFWIDPAIPDDIDNITLAYTFFNAQSSRKRAAEGTTASN